MRKPKILVVVEGGLVQAICANEEVDVMLVDWDNINSGDDFPDDFDYPVEVSPKLQNVYKDKEWKTYKQIYETLKDLDV